MLTVHEARQLQQAAVRARPHEETIDRKLKEALMAGIMLSETVVKHDVGNDNEVAKYIQARYTAAGWPVNITAFELDRAHAEAVVYTLNFRLPPEPTR